MISPMISLLEEAVGDKSTTYESWTSWYIWEKHNAMNKSVLKCFDKDNKEMKSDTPEDIYQIIIDEPNYV